MLKARDSSAVVVDCTIEDDLLEFIDVSKEVDIEAEE